MLLRRLLVLLRLLLLLRLVLVLHRGLPLPLPLRRLEALLVLRRHGLHLGHGLLLVLRSPTE